MSFATRMLGLFLLWMQLLSLFLLVGSADFTTKIPNVLDAEPNNDLTKPNPTINALDKPLTNSKRADGPLPSGNLDPISIDRLTPKNVTGGLAVNTNRENNHKPLEEVSNGKNFTTNASNQSKADANSKDITTKSPLIQSSTTFVPFLINPSASTSNGTVPSIQLSSSTVSWLDVFMLSYRDIYWKVFNTVFTVMWFILSLTSLYRLLDLNLCSPHLSRTQYLVIHLLSFTAGVFEIVQLLHLNFGRHQGLPLFLTLLLTHTPTPLLAACIITMCYCVLTSCNIPIVGRYSPPLRYLAILCSFLIVFSFVGDIIVGVTRRSVLLLLIRFSINAICILFFLNFISKMKKLSTASFILRRDLSTGELEPLNALSQPIGDETHEKKVHLKAILIPWSRFTLASCISGTIMCICCSLMTVFFTISYVPLWAFWTLHSTIFLMQVIIVINLTLAATLTLTCCTPKNLFMQYILPSMLFHGSSDVTATSCTEDALVKRSNILYQRVAIPNIHNGAAVVLPTQRMAVTPIPVVNRSLDEVDNNTQPQQDVHNTSGTLIVTDYLTPTLVDKPRTSLKRSATFNCELPTSRPTQFYGASPTHPQCSTPIYPLLANHLLPHSNSQGVIPRDQEPLLGSASGVNKGVNYHRPMTPSSHHHQIYPSDCDLPYRYISRYPSKSYYARDHFSSLRRTHSARRQKSDISGPIFHSPEFRGTVEAMEIAYQSPAYHYLAPRPPFSGTHAAYYSNNGNNMIQRHAQDPMNSYHLKPDVIAKKPVRKVEPILVRGVLKDNTVVENTRVLNETSTVNPVEGYGVYSKRGIEASAMDSPTYDTPGRAFNSYSPSSHSSPYQEKCFVYGNNFASNMVEQPICLEKNWSADKNLYTKEYPEGMMEKGDLSLTSSSSSFAQMNGNSREFHSFNKASNTNLDFTAHSPSNRVSKTSKIAMGSRSPVLSYRSSSSKQSCKSPSLRSSPLHNTSLEISASLATPESLSLQSSSDCDDREPKEQCHPYIDEDDKDNCSEKTLKGSSSLTSFSSSLLTAQTDQQSQSNSATTTTTAPTTDLDDVVTGMDKKGKKKKKRRRSLKRNHSTAGDFVPTEQNTETNEDGIQEFSREKSKEKYPWYGTWGGGRKNKNKSAGSLETGTGLAQYGKRTGSKSSLSNLYGKLRKPGRSRSMYQTDDDNDSETVVTGNDENSRESNADREGENAREDSLDEDNDPFLPRLTEEIDLESEILKSSTMLANFYSLNRSELKQRRKEREQIENEDKELVNETKYNNNEKENAEEEIKSNTNSQEIFNDNDLNNDKRFVNGNENVVKEVDKETIINNEIENNADNFIKNGEKSATLKSNFYTNELISDSNKQGALAN